jgi:hypothetical protein
MQENRGIPITVGVVGHLDALSTDEQRLQIRNFFSELASYYPNSPIHLFSSLADGADRFVARIFLDLKHSGGDLGNRFELLVPLPFDMDEYKKDFNEDSKQEFELLLNQAKRHFCTGCDSLETSRPHLYLKAGKFVADSSIILIALWDGKEGKTGGTADIINHKIMGDNENVGDSTFEYDGTVFVIPSVRVRSAGNIALSNHPPLTLESVLNDTPIRMTLEKIEEINSLSPGLPETSFTRSEEHLYKYRNDLDTPLEMLLSWYSRLDVFSLHYHRKDKSIMIWLFTLGFCLIAGLEIYSNLIVTNIALGLVMLLALSAILIYRYSKTTDNHKKYLYYRILAEALRIQFYWNLAGICRNASDYILRIHRKDFTWIKYIMSAIYGITYNNRTITSVTINDLIENWVKDQAAYFGAKLKIMKRQFHLLNFISNTSFIIGFLLLVSIFFFGEFYSSRDYMDLIFVLFGILIGIFALIKGYVEMQGYEQLHNQYELMHLIYSRAESKVSETKSYNLDEEEWNLYLRELFFVVGKEALIENGNWYLIFKEREPEIKGI